MTMVDELDAVSGAYRQYAIELQRFVSHRIRDVAASEDIVHEAYLRLALEARANRFPRQPRAWLYRTAMNLVISRARHAAVAASFARKHVHDDVDQQTPERAFLAGEQHARLGRAMRKLGTNGRTGLVLAAEGYSGREIARTIARSEVATRALLRRARIAIRRDLLLAEAV